MDIAPLLRLVADAFAQMGEDPTSASCSYLLGDGRFVGHRFRCGDLQATWLVNSTVIEFFSAGGELLRTISVEQDQAKAA